MAGSGSSLAPLLSTHELKLVCAQCSVQEKEITYRLKSVNHQCAHNILLCKAKGGSKWRPVSKRPLFPVPSQYQVCYFFKEGFGCTHHSSRCTFARSDEEAAVWTFEKGHRLDQLVLRHLVSVSEKESDPPDSSDPLHDLSATLDLKVACDVCAVKEKEITYTIRSVSHKCSSNHLLAKAKASDQWRPVSERPTCGQFGRNVLYQKCNSFVEGSGCTQHGQKCTYARSHEEAIVWNHVRDKEIDKDELIKRVIESLRVSVTPESTAESILQQFSGEFIELCKDCFHDRPQKLTGKRWNATCAADAAHAWHPVLVYRLSENSKRRIYSQVRPLPQNCKFEYCSHVRNAKPCWHQAGHCRSAQSEVEMAVWKAEHSGLSVRPHLLQLSRRGGAAAARPVTVYCKVCLLELSSPESFYNHCSSLEHTRLLSEDTTTKWRRRQPPHNLQAEMWLCERPETCEYGNKCPKAHSEEELQEWMMRATEEKEIRCNMETQGFMCYNERILQEYKNSSNEVHIMSEHVDDVCIFCDEDLNVKCEQTNATLHWKFQVETERQLAHVALLKQEPGASFTLGDISSEPCIYSAGENFLSEDMTYAITVSFTSINQGLYEQWLVLDFDMRPVLLRKLRVKVGQLSLDDAEQPTVNHGATLQASQSVGRWHRGNRVIIPCSSRTEEQEELLKEYKPPQISFLYKSSHNSQTPMNNENYKERMHHFLYKEEQAEDKVVSRLNVCGEVTTLDTLKSPQLDLMRAPMGQLFCAVSIPCNLTPDSPEGQALRRSIQSGLIAPLSSNGCNSMVYEATILQDRTCGSKMHLQLSKKCCSNLTLKSNESYQMEVQFQLNRHSFCTMHRAVDLLPNTKRVLPDLKNCGVPVNDIPYEKLNTKQQSAIDFITGNSSDQKFVAPLLIYGPFGTGKTFTLATAARELCKQPHNKVLICTHTNSSADLYIRDHLHPFINKQNDGMRPIRFKANKQGNALFATDEITLKYCFLSEDRQYFLSPTKAALDGHKIVITTTSMARFFHDLKLPEGYFTHILIDEASQMLECEALMALGLAGPNTRVVLAGDHMQMGPKLFSVDDHHRSDHTLLNRLFHYYQSQKCDAAEKSRIIFCENYRSTKEIVEFVSTNFYVGKNDVIKATGNIPAPANGHALKFYHARGECLLDTVSWYNKEEVSKVVEAVKEILECWPLTWGNKDQSSICVLSEGIQVRHIRAALARRSLNKVHVENLANVQGKQFRAVIITAVQTRDSLKTSHLPGLELFNDARVLNTAMTRAQSQVVVVGDAAALCCFGKCSGVWKSYIDHCVSNNSISPQHFTKDFFEKDVIETARFQKSEHVDDSNTLTDTILQELKDEYEQLKTEYSSDEDSLESEDLAHHKSNSSHNTTDADLLELCAKHPDMYEQGKLYRESYNRGYVIPFNNPTRHINIRGKENLGKGFTGDEVVLQTPRVVSIVKEAESARVLVCKIEDEDHSRPRQNSEDVYVRRMMVPITKSAPKICILILKKMRNFLPIYEQIDGQWTVASRARLDEKLTQNNVFVVQVVCWKEHCYYPLGKVIDILPIGESLENGLRILNEEFKVAPRTCVPGIQGFSEADENRKYRQDMREIITFTVDPKGAKDLDDAISVISETGDHYELGVHIADVASFVSRGSELDDVAKESGATYYCGTDNTIHMFPQLLSTKRFSLLSGQDRSVVSLMFKVNKKTHQIIGEPTFQLSLINSNKQLSYEEAEDIITEHCGTALDFGRVEHCVTVAYCFAKTQRKNRLVDWAYSQPDDQRLPGKRKAKLMIEELSVLFNRFASEILLGSEKTRSYTPLRCQAEPVPEKMQEFKEKCGELIPLSFHVQRKVHGHDKQVPNGGNFRVLTKVWEDIQSAARADDIDKMVDLIAADDIHPLLQPVIDQFRKCSSKAYVIRSNSSPKATVGHYSLSVSSYTQASSPIRRYMDIILQRLLQSVICNRSVQYTRTEISSLCNEFEHNFKNAKEYERKAEQISYAVSMKKQSASKLAFVVSADPDRESFAVSFPFNKNIFAESLAIMYKDLQLWDQPLYDEENHCITLKWKKRIYAADTMQIHQELEKSKSGPCVELPMTIWRSIVEAINNEEFNCAKDFVIIATNQLENSNTSTQSSKGHPKTNTCTSVKQEVPKVQRGHEVDIDFQLQRGDTLQVQMTSEVRRGYHMPAVQLVQIKPTFEVCVDHVHSPITCFSKSTDDPSRIHYSDTDEYIRIWKPLCEMESASTAVNESDSIVIEGLVVNFIQEWEGVLTGSFFLPEAWINEWAIECNLSKCLLCIRKRGLKLTSALEHSSLVDPSEYTWVAHGVTRKTERKIPPNEGSTVEFYANHLPMETIPEFVFQKNTCFTVEIIPKLLPDIRKESAVVSIATACDLVKAIALGKHIPKEVQTRWQRTRNDLPHVLPELNPSQRHAVDKALNNAFTLIQGPPGTGKTVVGVYIVCCFLKMNSENPRQIDGPKNEKKKQVILYCGPSNKSVDVVAEYLLRFGDTLKPLRVYSQQVEMLDYPYPSCILQFYQRTLRQERAKPELRSITLHHRMREEQNPYSGQIKDFDKRIQLALDKIEELRHKQLALEDKDELQRIQLDLKKAENQVAEEVKKHRELLRDARTYELERHDIILCTCTQSSTPSLTKTVSARQILIDECAMATEPQALIPLVCNKPEKIVLIGDHKQLRPIVKNERVRRLGMAKSLFERYYTMHEKRAVMLDTQYRMHEDICKFPSTEYYEGKLKTGVEQLSSVLHVDKKTMPFVFGNIEGKTISLIVNTAKGNENSKANKKEAAEVTRIAKMLVENAKIEQESIVILSPYNAQVSEIRDELKKDKMDQITVTTITKSQGSEWRYVIISTVCSLPSEEIERDPDRAWLSQHLGFVGDPNQINVGITRAKEGLCIIGNQELLSCSRSWKKLLNYYRLHNAVTKACEISVCSAT